MAKFNGKFESEKQDWPTPIEMFDKLNDEYGFTIDLAASEENKKCEAYYSEEENSLDMDWVGVCWLNPPYGGVRANSLKNWIKKGLIESQKHGSTVVILCPARTNTNWWHEYCMKAKEIKFICGRPKFGKAKHGLPQPLALVVFSPHKQDSPKITSFHLPQ